ncbi:M56 family metallopeptidase, partial [Zavarzinella formosa]|uniref:M56 family metallopeptidase n=1 Tax=Zavarzinella formosa TaxID=360055 RepID=UPI00187DA830
MRTLIEYALTNALMATLLAAIVYGVTWFVRRPAVRNALWLLVLIRLLLPPVLGVPLPIDSPVSEPVAVPVVAPVMILPEPVSPAKTGELTPEELALALAFLEENPATTEGAMTKPVSEQPRPAVTTLATPTTSVSRWQLVYLLIGLVWLGGTVWIAGRSVWLVRRFQRMLRDATPAPASCQNQAEGLARVMGLAACPEVLMVPGRLWPSLWAPVPWRRNAKLLIPAGLWPLLDAEQRRAVLAHELSHCRRGDPWVRWLELVAVAVYWWYLPLGWVRRQLRQSEEECCDMWVVAALEGRKAYATALVETAGYLSGPEPAFSSALSSGAGPVEDIQRRVTMIMRATWPARLTRLGLATVLGLGTVGMAFGPTLGSADAQERKSFPKKDGDRKDREDEGQRGPRDGERGDRKDGERKDDERGERGDRKGGDRKDGDRGPRDGDRKDRGPRDGGDRKEGRGEAGPAPREKSRDGGDVKPDVKAAREEAETARAEFRKAVEKMRAAEEKLAKAEGRPVNFPMMGGFGGG